MRRFTSLGLAHRLCGVALACALAAGGAAAGSGRPPNADPLEVLALANQNNAAGLIAQLGAFAAEHTGYERATALWMRINAMRGEEMLDRIDPVLRELDAMGQGTDDVARTASALAALARSRLGANGTLTAQSLKMAEDALQALPREAPPLLRARVLVAVGRMQQDLSKTAAAIASHRAAADLLSAHGSRKSWGNQLINVAYALYLAEQLDAAMRVADQSVQVAQELNDKLNAAYAHNTRALIHAGLDHREAQIADMQRALELGRELGNTDIQMLVLGNLGDAYIARKQYDKAVSAARESIALAKAERAENTLAVSVAQANGGVGLIGMGHTAEGLAMVNRALQREEQAGNMALVANIHAGVAEMLESTGQLQAAWQAYGREQAVRTELKQREQQKAIVELQERFESERRQRDIALLTAEQSLTKADIERHRLQQLLWRLVFGIGAVVLAGVALLMRRLWASNARLNDSNAELAVASGRDPLTGLANRRHFLDALQAHGQEVFRGTAVLIDIDHFKQINDRHGHAAGDAVLIEIAARLARTVGANDLAVRWGGEEFVIVVPNGLADRGEALVASLLHAIAAEPVVYGESVIPVTASIGFATLPLPPLRHPVTWERALDMVDTAMYLAKAHGRNRAYGVYALDPHTAQPVASTPLAQAAAAASAPINALDAAWRSGHAELKVFPGPGLPVETA